MTTVEKFELFRKFEFHGRPVGLILLLRRQIKIIGQIHRPSFCELPAVPIAREIKEVDLRTTYISLDDLKKIDVRSGIIVRREACGTSIGFCEYAVDFGDAGIKTCRLPASMNEMVDELVGLNVIAALNLPHPTVLSAMCSGAGCVLLTTTKLTRPGSQVLCDFDGPISK